VEPNTRRTGRRTELLSMRTMMTRLVIVGALLAMADASLLAQSGPREPRQSTLWASPTEGLPLEVNWLPGDSKLVIAIRPASLLASEEGQRVRRALGPAIGVLTDSLTNATERPLTDFDSILLAAAPSREGRPHWTLKARLANREPVRFHGERVVAPEGRAPAPLEGVYYRWNGQAWFEFLRQADRRSDETRSDETGAAGSHDETGAAGSQLWMGREAELLAQWKDADRVSIMSPRFEQIVQSTDRDRHVTIVASTSFLLGEGKKWFHPTFGWLIDALDQLRFEKVDMIVVSLHLGPNYQFFGEVQLFHRADARPQPLSKKFYTELERAPNRIEDWLSNLNSIDRHWRKLAMRMPRMIRVLVQQARLAVENQHPVLTFSLPAHAAHNLVAAIEMSFSEASSTVTGPVTASLTPPAIKSWKSLLRQQVDLEIRQDSLDTTLRILESKITSKYPTITFPFRIRIVGADLQDEGITRNQQIRGLRLVDKTIGEVLTAVAIAANPITKVKSAAETDQKLIWTVANDPKVPEERIVLITTRKAAKKKGYPLPPAFRP